MWKALIEKLTIGHNFIRINDPATVEDILKIEKELGVAMPSELKDLLLELNGDDCLIFSAERLIETNLMMRELKCLMPLDCLLFFGGNGCGDYYGYAITGEGIDGKIYIWEHETDSRIEVAYGLKDAIKKYYTDEI